jgi:hypothetical protein
MVSSTASKEEKMSKKLSGIVVAFSVAAIAAPLAQADVYRAHPGDAFRQPADVYRAHPGDAFRLPADVYRTHPGDAFRLPSSARWTSSSWTRLVY